MSESEMVYMDSSFRDIPSGFRETRVGWTAPSNIALVKYWGKKAGQIPENASLSLTLSRSITETVLSASRTATGRGVEPECFFEGGRNPVFEKRISAYLEDIMPYFPFLGKLKLRIETRNTFPHSAGMASSASGFSALALCICTLEEKVSGRPGDADFFRKASCMARLGSGSASRSVYGGYSGWGRVKGLNCFSDQFAVPVALKASSVFSTLYDAVLLVSTGPKEVSSSRGHELMHNHPFAKARYVQAGENFINLLRSLESGDVPAFIRIVENEALSLHALLYSSDPGFILLREDSLAILTKIREFRRKTGSFLTFTIDAGPNIHLLYPESERGKILRFIKNDLLSHCENRNWIDDRMGQGPEEIPDL